MKKFIRSSWENEEEGNDIYSSDFRATLVEDGELDSWEEAFMEGHDEAG
jgi:hypothetical protein